MDVSENIIVNDVSENIIVNDVSENIIVNDEWPPFFIKCQLCDFETRYLQELKFHILSKNHQQKEDNEKRENLGWFWFFGKIDDYLLS
jgi:hypothetical protein